MLLTQDMFPKDPPPGRIHPANYAAATEALVYELFNHAGFRDKWKQYTDLKYSGLPAKRDDAHSLFPALVKFEQRLKSYVKTQGLVSYENLTQLFVDLGLGSPISMPDRAWVAPKAHSRFQDVFRRNGIPQLPKDFEWGVLSPDETLSKRSPAYQEGETDFPSQWRRKRRRGAPFTDEVLTEVLMMANSGIGKKESSQELFWRRIDSQKRRVIEMWTHENARNNPDFQKVREIFATPDGDF